MATTINIVRGASPTTNGVYDVTLYGAKGDGSTDDTTAIQAAIDAVESAGAGEVYFPGSGPYIISGELTVAGVATNGTGPHMKINFAQAEIKSTANDEILHIGTSTTTPEYVRIEGGSLRYSTTDYTKTSRVGILMENCYHCEVRGTAIHGAFSGIELRGSHASLGCSYNYGFNLVFRDCLNAYRIDRQTDGSFINENAFFGGRTHYSSSLNTVDCSSGYAVNMTMNSGSGSRLNNNRWYGVSFECGMTPSGGGAKPLAINYIGNYNLFSHPRFEGFATPLVTFDSSSDKMQFIAAASAIDDMTDITTAQPQSVQLITDSHANFHGGSVSIPAMRVSNTVSGNNVAFAAANAAQTTDVFQIYGNGSVRFYPVTGSGVGDVEGMLYYDSDDNKLKINIGGSVWHTIDTTVVP